MICPQLGVDDGAIYLDRMLPYRIRKTPQFAATSGYYQQHPFPPQDDDALRTAVFALYVHRP